MVFREMVERDWVINFLAGLNNDLDDVRGRIVGMKPLPSIEETFAVVRREESKAYHDGRVTKVLDKNLA